MKMIQCPDCKKNFSIAENVCPFCGCPVDNNFINNIKIRLKAYLHNLKAKNKKTIFFTCLGIISAIFIIIMISFKRIVFFSYTDTYSTSTREVFRLKVFGKCEYSYEFDSKDKHERKAEKCSWKKRGTTYIITMKEKELNCDKDNGYFNCTDTNTMRSKIYSILKKH